MMLKHRAAYVAFDLFPTAKGASTHISHMARFLFGKYGGGLLMTLGTPLFPRSEIEGNIEIDRYNSTLPNYLDRGHAFGLHVHERLQRIPSLEVVHFRDIWSGMAVLQERQKYRTLFEVNGLPSIELPYRYPSIMTSTLDKIRDRENWCFTKSDHLIAPSSVIKQHLIHRGIDEQKIDVVSNAAHSAPLFAKVADLPQHYLLYFGALQTWQGIDVLLKAFALLKDRDELRLVICCAGKKKYSKIYMKLAEKLGVGQKVIWLFQLEKKTLNTYINKALMTIAPLKACSRNVEQGCSPLKIFESMACGTAVVASDLPVIREIIDDGISGKLVAPDRPQALSRAIRLLLEYPEKRLALARAGKALITSTYNWDNIEKKMSHLYEEKFCYEQ